MQEEVENRVYNLVITTTRLAANTVISAGRKYLDSRKHKKQLQAKDINPHGKQSVKKLIGQGQGVSKVDVSKTDLQGFQRYARKYGVDFAIRKDRSTNPPRYFVFFKSKDSDALSAAFSEYAAAATRKRSQGTLLDVLQQYKEKVKEQIGKALPHKEHVR